MIYSSRLKKILHYCLTHREESVSLDELADLLKISKRTIFRELKDIDKDLSNYELKLENKSGKGLCILGNEANKDALLFELKTQGIEYINKEERQHLLIFELLNRAEITKLLHYANLFQVSEATISNDLDIIESWFQKHKLQLVRKTGLGVEVLGDEANMRKAMTSLLHETLSKNNAYDEVNYFDSQTLLKQIFIKDDQNSIMRLLNQDILERILHVFHTYQHELGLDRYAQSSYIGLIIHLVIAIDRIMKEEEIVDNEQVLKMIDEDFSFHQAEKIAQYLEIEFDIDIPKTEIAFIALHIKGSKINNVEYSEVKENQLTRMYDLISKMLNSYDEDISMHLLQDEQLIHGLLTHLEPTIIRLHNHLPIFNPLLSQIKEMYYELFNQTKKACEWITKEFDCEVSEDEVGFVTMHIGAALERIRQGTFQHAREITIGVVCASGIGVSALLSARIQKAFPANVKLHILSMEEVLRNEYEDCEFLVSTFPLTSTSVDVYCVSPLLDGDDVMRLKKALEERQKQEVFKNQTKVKDFCKQVEAVHRISEYILDFLNHVQLTILKEACDKKSLISRIGVDHGDDEVRTQVIEADIRKREKMGTVVMKDFGFAMFHAISEGVAHCSMHLYYPNTKIFTTPDFQGLKFVMVLLSNPDKEHEKQKMLATISRGMIENKAFYEAILQRDRDALLQECGVLLHTYLIESLEEIL